MKGIKLILIWIAVALMALPAIAQTAVLRGLVTDESGAVIPAAKVTLSGPDGLSKSTVAGNDGTYRFTGLPAGAYTVAASAPELTLREPAKVSLSSGALKLNLLL